MPWFCKNKICLKIYLEAEVSRFTNRTCPDSWCNALRSKAPDTDPGRKVAISQPHVCPVCFVPLTDAECPALAVGPSSWLVALKLSILEMQCLGC